MNTLFKKTNIFKPFQTHFRCIYSKQIKSILNQHIYYLDQSYQNLSIQMETYNLYYDDPLAKKEMEYIKDKINQIKYDYKFEKKNTSLLIYHIDLTKEKCLKLNQKIFYYL